MSYMVQHVSTKHKEDVHIILGYKKFSNKFFISRVTKSTIPPWFNSKESR